MHPWQKRARECEFCSTEPAHHRRGQGALPTTRIAVACSCSAQPLTGGSLASRHRIACKERLVWLGDSVTATTTDLADDIAQLLFNRALSEFATAMKAVRSAKSPRCIAEFSSVPSATNIGFSFLPSVNSLVPWPFTPGLVPWPFHPRPRAMALAPRKEPGCEAK
jgi:hypothetical protein